jgi:hypothetical protein
MMPGRLSATVVIIAGTVHEIHDTDVIEFGRQFWLVPEWLDSPVLKICRPARMISLETLAYQRMGGSFDIRDPIPKSVYEGRVTPELANKFIVVELPPIVFPMPPRLH